MRAASFLIVGALQVSTAFVLFPPAKTAQRSTSTTTNNNRQTVCFAASRVSTFTNVSPTMAPPRIDIEPPSPADVEPAPKKKTLYEVLNAQPTETRTELKKRYVAMAKICHPDAQRNRAGDAQDEIPDFTEVAAAWKILSDPKQRKRYDRSLQAEEFSENVLTWVGDFAKDVAPVVENFGTVANNFFRKTTATTLAGVQAAATQVSKKPEPQTQVSADPKDTVMNVATSDAAVPKRQGAISEALRSAVDAARLAGRKVDSLELIEKSEALELRASSESAQAERIKRELQDIVERRLSIALHTPGAGLTAAEASLILEDFNRTVADHLTPWDRAMLRHTVEYEISELQREEAAFIRAQQTDSEAQTLYQVCVQSKVQAKQNLLLAEKAETRAREAWESAKEGVLTSRKSLGDSVRELAQAESHAKKSDWEMEMRSLALEKQAEKVRTALQQKERVVMKERGLEPPVMSDTDSLQRIEEVNNLRNEERLMAETSKRLELMSERLYERAHALRERAQELDEEEEEEKE